MASSKPPACNGWYMPQLKIVLLGGRNSGKSCVGNLLLGKEEFVTNERTCCSRRVGVITGHWLTVVDTPGWWCDMSLRDTSKLVKREILNSVTLCSPGPHVFVIVVKASSTFTERRRRAVEEHVQLLGDAVWSHCLLVLTFKDRWTLREAEKHEQRAGQETLQWLYNKCGHRCHSLVVNDDSEEVTKLVLKIERMVAANGNTHFEMSEQILQRISKDRKRIEERAHHRFKMMKQCRAKMRENLKPMSEIRIVLLGAKGSGKSSVFNTILSKQNAPTHQSSTHTAISHVGEAVVFGRHVTIVDTPGWWCNYFSEETSIFDKREIILSLSLSPPGPHAFLMVIRIDRAFTDTHRKSVEEHIELISNRIWSRIIVLFTFGDWLGGTTTEQYIECEGEAMQWVVDRCSNRYHVLNNKTKGDGFQVRELIGKIEEMVVGGGCDWYFEIEGSVIKDLKQKMREETDRAEERRMKKEKQRQMARTHLECLTPLQGLQIVLIGGSKTGKSSCGNTILSRDCFVAETSTTSCIENQGKVNGKTVAMLDTFGLFSVSSEFFSTLSAFLLVVNISSAFKDVHLKAIKDQLGGAAPQIWSKAMVVFSFGDWLGDTTIEQRIESEGHLLQTLVARCGNRYHVLDNKNRECKTQINELIEYTEEILAEEMFQRGDHMTREVPLPQEELEAMCKMDSNEKPICRNQLSHDLADAACAMPTTATGQMVTLSEGRTGQQPRLRDRGAFMSCLATLVSVKNRLLWTDVGQMLRVNFPFWILGDDLNAGTQLFSPNLAAVLPLPQAQSSMLTVENVNPVHTLCHPMLIDQTLRRLNQYGGLQALIDQWGDSSLEELEAFIDLYFQMVWEQAMQETQPEIQSTEEDIVEEKEVFSSIDKKLSKLDLLEDIKADLAELRKSLEHCMKAIKELKRQDKDET